MERYQMMLCKVWVVAEHAGMYFDSDKTSTINYRQILDIIIVEESSYFQSY